MGVEVTPELLTRGTEFISGVIDRAGESALSRLWTESDALPTPNELDAPGLWLARIDLPNLDSDYSDFVCLGSGKSFRIF